MHAHSRACTRTTGSTADLIAPSAPFSSFDLNKGDSKLPPLAGTLEERTAQLGGKSDIQRNVEEYLAPTPAGQVRLWVYDGVAWF